MFQIHASWMRVATRTEPLEFNGPGRSAQNKHNLTPQRRPLRWLRRVLGRKPAQ